MNRLGFRNLTVCCIKSKDKSSTVNCCSPLCTTQHIYMISTLKAYIFNFFLGTNSPVSVVIVVVLTSVAALLLTLLLTVNKGK